MYSTSGYLFDFINNLSTTWNSRSIYCIFQREASFEQCEIRSYIFQDYIIINLTSDFDALVCHSIPRCVNHQSLTRLLYTYHADLCVTWWKRSKQIRRNKIEIYYFIGVFRLICAYDVAPGSINATLTSFLLSLSFSLVRWQSSRHERINIATLALSVGTRAASRPTLREVHIQAVP